MELKSIPDHPSITAEKRAIGNKILYKLLEATGTKGKFDTYLLNKWDYAQSAMYHSQDNIAQLLEGNPPEKSKRWKWIQPLAIYKDSDMVYYGDPHNCGFAGCLGKGKLGVSIISPDRYERLAGVYREGIDSMGDSAEKINYLCDILLKEMPMQTPYLNLRKRDDVIYVASQEGAHRAAAARKAGIESMPLYVYANNFTFSEWELEMLGKNIFEWIQPRNMTQEYTT